MPRQILSTPDAPASPLYSQGIRSGRHVYVSGMTGMDPRTKQLAGAGIGAQVRQALLNCEAILRSGGAARGDVVEVNVLMADPVDFGGMNEEYAKFFPAAPPTRCVTRLGVELPGVRVSIRMTAVVDG